MAQYTPAKIVQVKAWRHSPAFGYGFFGPVLCDWGIFNFVEGVTDHQILGIHHVLPGSPQQLAADLAFLVSGVLFFLIGRFLTPAVESRYHLVAA